jgi:ferritin-like metal-binding protein YciE
MLIQLAEKLNVQDAISILKQNLQEEEVMATWLMANVPTMLNRLWAYIESSSGNRTTSTTTSV